MNLKEKIEHLILTVPFIIAGCSSYSFTKAYDLTGEKPELIEDEEQLKKGIFREIKENQIIIVGEAHHVVSDDYFFDQILQQAKKLEIKYLGLELPQVPFQRLVDNYVLGREKLDTIREKLKKMHAFRHIPNVVDTYVRHIELAKQEGLEGILCYDEYVETRDREGNINDLGLTTVRDKEQLRNIKNFLKDKKGKMLILIGVGHSSKRPTYQVRVTYHTQDKQETCILNIPNERLGYLLTKDFKVCSINLTGSRQSLDELQGHYDFTVHFKPEEYKINHDLHHK